MTDTAGLTHHITLDGVGYMLDEKRYLKLEATSRDAHTLRVWAQHDWSAGSARVADPEHGFLWAEGLAPYYQGARFGLGPSLTQVAGNATADPLFCAAAYNDTLYLGMGDNLYAATHDGAGAYSGLSLLANLAANAYTMAVWDDTLYVATAGGTLYAVDTLGTVTNLGAGLGAAVAPFRAGLWAGLGESLRYQYEPAAAWQTFATVHGGATITRLLPFRDALIVATRYALFELSGRFIPSDPKYFPNRLDLFDGQLERVFDALGHKLYDTDAFTDLGRTLTEHQGDLYFCAGGRVFVYTGAGADLAQLPLTGTAYGLASVRGLLLISVDSPRGGTSLLAWDGRGAWEYARGTTAATAFRVLAPAAGLLADADLLVGTATTGDLHRLQLNLSDAGPVAPAASGTLVSALFDAGRPDLFKLWRYAAIAWEADGATDADQAWLYYSLDRGDTWALLGIASAPAPYLFQSFDFQGAVASRSIQYQVVLHRGVGPYYPQISAVYLGYTLIPPLKWRWQLRLLFADNLVRLDGGRDADDARARLGRLLATRDANTRVTFHDVNHQADGDPCYVVLSDFEQHIPLLSEPHWLDGHVDLVLTEV